MELPVDASKFAGMSEEQARTFPRRTLVGEPLTPEQIAAMPKMISTDSHVMEPDELWQELTPRLRDNLPKVPFRNSPPGATNPQLRLRDQDADGVAAEILFPNYGMALFGITDVATQQESFRLYNDWIRDFCQADTKRLYGVPLVSVYDINAGIKEMQRGHDMGLKGAMLWQVPDPRLPFTSEHYEPLWAACAEAGAPVICHILTGHSYVMHGHKKGAPGIKDSVNTKTFDTANTLFARSAGFHSCCSSGITISSATASEIRRCRSSASRAKSLPSTCTERFLRTMSEPGSCHGGARTTACGRTTILISI
jgi:predicted TIM-barrel fold metal-dependent hydrolase